MAGPFFASFLKIITNGALSFGNMLLFIVELTLATKIVRSLRLEQWFHVVSPLVRFSLAFFITVVVFSPINSYLLRYIQALLGSGAPLAKFFTGVEFLVFVLLLVNIYKKQS